MHDDTGFIDTLRLGEAQLAELLDSLDHPTGEDETGDVQNRRAGADLRLPYRHPKLHLTIDHPGGGQSPFLVAGRNLTPRGLGFLHGNYLHSGTLGRVELPLTIGGQASIRCIVLWCRHIKNHIHEAAVRFERPIDLWRHIEGAEAAADLATRIDPSELRGRIIVFSDSELFRDMIGQQLSATKLDLHISGDLAELGKMAQASPPELALLDADFDTADVPAQVRTLRDAPLFCPILLATGEPSAQRIQPARDAGADGVLRKPFQPMQLLAVLLEWFTIARSTVDAADDAVDVTQRSPEFEKLIARYITALEKEIETLNQAIESDNFETARTVCRRIFESAGIFAMPSLSRLAKKALTQLDSCYSIEESASELQRLLQRARKACLDRGNKKKAA